MHELRLSCPIWEWHSNKKVGLIFGAVYCLSSLNSPLYDPGAWSCGLWFSVGQMYSSGAIVSENQLSRSLDCSLQRQADVNDAFTLFTLVKVLINANKVKLLTAMKHFWPDTCSRFWLERDSADSTNEQSTVEVRLSSPRAVVQSKSNIRSSKGQVKVNQLSQVWLYNVTRVSYVGVVNTHIRFEVKRLKVKVTRLVNAETESVSPTNLKLGRRLVHALSTAMASYKGLWSWVIARGQGKSSRTN